MQDQTADPPVLIKDGSLEIELDVEYENAPPQGSQRRKHGIKIKDDKRHIQRVVVLRKNTDGKGYTREYNERFDPKTCKIKIFWDETEESE